MEQHVSSVIGIDPGLNHTGWAVVAQQGNRLFPVASGCIDTSPTQSDEKRLACIMTSLMQIASHYDIESAGVERTIVNANPMSSLRLGQSRGVVLAVLGSAGLEVGEYSPTAIKRALCGQGRGSKASVAAMVKMLLPAADLKKSDVSDAHAVAITHLRHCQWSRSIAVGATRIAR